MDSVKLKKDFLWYSIGAAIPMLLSFVKTPIFTRYYNPTFYGYFNLINATFGYINLFAFSWILSCVWRYYIHEKNNKELNKFYTNIIVLFFIGLMVTCIISLIWILITNNYLVRKLIIANCINLIATALTTIYLTVIRLDGESFIYNLYTIINSVFSFIILFILVFLLKGSIDAMINCSNIVNGIFIVYIIYKFNKKYILSVKDISKNLIKEFIKYGFATVIFSISLLLLTSGDRYVIKIYYSTDKVGIYSQIYGIAQISIVAIYTIFYNIINPYLFKMLEEDINNENEFYKYIVMYIVCVLPFTIYFSIYSKQIANLLLGEKFRIGYRMIPYIMVSSFICGLSVMHETRMKFKNKLKRISANVISASLINTVLNFIILPRLGYEWAAKTTLIAYICLYIMDIYADLSININEIYRFKQKFRLLFSIISILILQIFIHYYLINKFIYCTTVTYSIIEGLTFFAVYIIYVSRKLRYS